eukprot:1404413-Rhodomonas_salina.2
MVLKVAQEDTLEIWLWSAGNKVDVGLLQLMSQGMRAARMLRGGSEGALGGTPDRSNAPSRGDAVWNVDDDAWEVRDSQDDLARALLMSELEAQGNQTVGSSMDVDKDLAMAIEMSMASAKRQPAPPPAAASVKSSNTGSRPAPPKPAADDRERARPALGTNGMGSAGLHRKGSANQMVPRPGKVGVSALKTESLASHSSRAAGAAERGGQRSTAVIQHLKVGSSRSISERGNEHSAASSVSVPANRGSDPRRENMLGERRARGGPAAGAIARNAG